MDSSRRDACNGTRIKRVLVLFPDFLSAFWSGRPVRVFIFLLQMFRPSNGGTVDFGHICRCSAVRHHSGKISHHDIGFKARAPGACRTARISAHVHTLQLHCLTFVFSRPLCFSVALISVCFFCWPPNSIATQPYGRDEAWRDRATLLALLQEIEDEFEAQGLSALSVLTRVDDLDKTREVRAFVFHSSGWRCIHASIFNY